MSKDTKGALIIIGVAIIITVGIFFITRGKGNKKEVEIGEENIVEEEFVNVLSDGTKLNTSDKLQEKKKVGGLEVSKFQLTEQGNSTILLGTITNTSSTEQGGYDVEIVVVDKTGKELGRIPAYIKKLQPGESTQLNTGITGDYANAYNFSINKK